MASPSRTFSSYTDASGYTVHPLTSVFTPAPSCATDFTYAKGDLYQYPSGLLVQNAAAGEIKSSCFPSGFDHWGVVSLSQYFSPGWCPDGYTTPILEQAGPTTEVACCRSNYNYTSTSIIYSGGSFSADSYDITGCYSTLPSGSTTSVTALENDSGSLGSAHVTGPLDMWDQLILVMYQSTDLSLFPAATSASASASSTISGTTNILGAGSAVSGPPTSSSSPTPTTISSGGLSTGGKVAVGLGVSMGLMVIASLVLGAYLIRKRRKGKLAETTRTSNGDRYSGLAQEEKPPEYPTTPALAHSPGKPEGQEQEVFEMGAPAPASTLRPTELDSSLRVEMADSARNSQEHFPELPTTIPDADLGIRT